MTAFELGFIWINYYYAFHNSASNIVKHTVDDTVKETNVSKDVIDDAASFLSGFATVDNKKIQTINTFATTAGILLVSILILILVIIDCKGKGQNFSTNPRVIFASIATATSLAIFFGFFYFSTTSIYKMIPNDIDVLNSVKNVLENDIEAPEDIKVRPIVPVAFNDVLKMTAVLILVIYIGSKYIFPRFKALCKSE